MDRLLELLDLWTHPHRWESVWDYLDNANRCRDDASLFRGEPELAESARRNESVWRTEQGKLCAELTEAQALLDQFAPDLAERMPVIRLSERRDVYHLAERVNGLQAMVSGRAEGSEEEASPRVSMATLLGETGELLQAVLESKAGADERMRRLATIDLRYQGYTSKQWAELLGVSDGAIRQTPTWKKWRQDRYRD